MDAESGAKGPKKCSALEPRGPLFQTPACPDGIAALAATLARAAVPEAAVMRGVAEKADSDDEEKKDEKKEAKEKQKKALDKTTEPAAKQKTAKERMGWAKGIKRKADEQHHSEPEEMMSIKGHRAQEVQAEIAALPLDAQPVEGEMKGRYNYTKSRPGMKPRIQC